MPAPGTQSAETHRRMITIEERLDYLLFLPADYEADGDKEWPLILFLHGAGERGSDLDLVKKHGPPKRVEHDTDFPFIVVSPQCPAGQIWEDNALLGLLDDVLASHRVDTNRVYLTGLSMGGFGTWSLGMKHPERFAAIAPVCGGGQPLFIRLADERHKSQLRRLPVWAFHGGRWEGDTHQGS